MLRHEVFHQQLDHRIKAGSHSGLAELISQISRGALLDTRFAYSWKRLRFFRKEANALKMAISGIHLDPIQDYMYIRMTADSVHREVC